MSMNFLIRRGAYPDLPEIWQIMQDAARDAVRTDWFQPDDEQYIADHICRDGFLVVAQAPDGSIAGFFMIIGALIIVLIVTGRRRR